ncbi:MAG: protein-L-isoaspartate(D-aspartate) O-methyltransferase [Armatimonadota bacterium]|nr:protein-L-isoaspartate(D-aspartate) O-methyltransferase [Armatimonadota bacterium]MCX7777335.1 protein-L-isoaspartate(D-aspartate) O-methyltransferase [Armatimonadota bacterium]MDW8025397.1 protein-L-isoaspartate(D-aspartate) O-methyltransferase [Armatimonadota bacterium]
MQLTNAELQKGWIAALMFVCFILIALFLQRLSPNQSSHLSESDYERKRIALVEHLKRQGIKDEAVLKAMLKVPRHLFVPESHRYLSYEDTALPIGEGQTISQPFVVAFMTQALELKPTDRVLEIGTGSGYQAAILAELAKEVYTIEIIPTLAKRAEETLQKLGYKNVKVKVGDGYFGWKEYAPFDAIIVTCAPEDIPQPLIEQLKEGGRMIIPVGKRYIQQLYVLRKEGSKVVKRAVLDVLFVPMLGEAERRTKGEAKEKCDSKQGN